MSSNFAGVSVLTVFTLASVSFAPGPPLGFWIENVSLATLVTRRPSLLPSGRMMTSLPLIVTSTRRPTAMSAVVPLRRLLELGRRSRS